MAGHGGQSAPVVAEATAESGTLPTGPAAKPAAAHPPLDLLRLALPQDVAVGAPGGMAGDAGPPPTSCQEVASLRTPLTRYKPAADLQTLREGYQCILDNYVAPVDDRTLLRAAWTKLEQGQPPDRQADLALSGDSGADWAQLSQAVSALEAAQPGWQPDVPGALDAMAQSLDDRHTYYERPDEFETSRLLRSGSPTYTGIGIAPLHEDNHWIIRTVETGSPAAKAGLAPGDDIVSVNGASAASLTSRQLSAATRSGPVELALRHHGAGKLVDVTIVPGTIKPHVVDSRLIDGNVGYVRLASFSQGSASLVVSAANQLRSEGAASLILDLRGNGGGSLSELRRITGALFDVPSLGTMTDRDGASLSLRVRPAPGQAKLPSVIMIDQGSASASEVLAAAAQEDHASTLVGERSAGAVDALESWSLDDGSVMDITVARLSTPQGTRVDRVGLTPDVEVVPTLQDLFDAKDVQLDAAAATLEGRPYAHPSGT